MAMSAQEIVASIACDEATFKQSPEKFSGFVRKVTSSRVDFYWKDAVRIPTVRDQSVQFDVINHSDSC